ncbi:hypothetical protein RG836_10770 [Pseudomonas sp. SZMC_28357]|uniref:hypothetical protein n=1 Tax=Pseudomonas sp. SZMC_28357 TaxID=3074380 RepID=UPI002870F7F9|nr:hypothetical protein [Pseudomonas sp. SZMC_28357]MDR9751931.1 hypothetical protein [Pseudomonas sp. SZMC_28357]
MTSIGALSPGSGGVQTLLDVPKSATQEAADADARQAPPVNAGIQVSLSGAGLTQAAGATGKNSDIEESGLPQNIQQILKMIRSLQQQIAEKTARIKAVLADKFLSNEAKIAKLAALRGAIASLNNGLITANLSLSKVMNQSDLSPEQVMKTVSLLFKD